MYLQKKNLAEQFLACNLKSENTIWNTHTNSRGATLQPLPKNSLQIQTIKNKSSFSAQKVNLTKISEKKKNVLVFYRRGRIHFFGLLFLMGVFFVLFVFAFLFLGPSSSSSSSSWNFKKSDLWIYLLWNFSPPPLLR